MAESNTRKCGSDEIEIKNLEERQKIIDRAPFRHLKINDAGCLDNIEGREICGKCYKSRKFFCYSCYSPVIDQKYIPRIKVTRIYIKISYSKIVQAHFKSKINKRSLTYKCSII